MLTKKASLEIARWSALAALLQSCNLNTNTPHAAIADGSITETRIADGAVSNRKLQTDAVHTVNILDGNVTIAKLDPAINFTTTGTLAAAGNFAINTSKFTVAAASGNTLAAGTLTVQGNALTVGTAGTAGTFTVGSASTSGTSEFTTTLSGPTILQTTKDGTANQTEGTQPLTVTRSDTFPYNNTGAPALPPLTHKVASFTFNVNPTGNSATDAYLGVLGEADLTVPFTGNQLTGVFGKVTVTNAAPATISTGIGVDSLLSFSNVNGTITNAYGYHSKLSLGTSPGTVGTYAGLYIEDPAGGAASGFTATRYGIFADGTTTSNFFAGKVGIGAGKMAPAVALDVNGAGSFSGAITGATLTMTGAAATAGADAYVCVTAGGVLTTGNGTGCAPAASDRRLKKEITAIGGALEKILSLTGVTYLWKDEARGKGRQIGLIAQDVEKAFPEAVSRRADGFLGIHYQLLVGPLVEGLKELYAKWNADHQLLVQQDVKLGQLEKKLEIENVALRAENKSLKDRLEKIEQALAAAPAPAPAKSGRKLATK